MGTSAGSDAIGVAAVIFDWDGVLLDSLGSSYNVYNIIFEAIGTKR